ncbi:MAG: hypothetical protein QM703_12150 [Gemmatales bacterium]
MNTFVDKVQFERQFLKTVNSYCKSGSQLKGLSLPAIHSWIGQFGIEKNDMLLTLLVKAGVGCQSISNRSNQNFMKLTKAVTAEFDSINSSLENELRTRAQSGLFR